MRTNVTDVVVILFTYMPDFLEIDSNVQVSVVPGVGFNTICISVKAIAAYICKGAKNCCFCTQFEVVIILQAFIVSEK